MNATVFNPTVLRFDSMSDMKVSCLASMQPVIIMPLTCSG